VTLLLGCIADDLTGATDLANMLVREGMRTVQSIGVPEAGLALPDTDAVVVALKSRTIPPGKAVAGSVSSLDWLRGALGRERAGTLVEGALARIATALVDAGIRKLIVAGGETSGAVVQALGVKALRIGPQIDPGVPWTVSVGEPSLALALKSGNFGALDFLTRALDMLT
jgi:uncharacterized protein YgbK (DUF1537 family)